MHHADHYICIGQRPTTAPPAMPTQPNRAVVQPTILLQPVALEASQSFGPMPVALHLHPLASVEFAKYCRPIPFKNIALPASRPTAADPMVGAFFGQLSCTYSESDVARLLHGLVGTMLVLDTHATKLHKNKSCAFVTLSKASLERLLPFHRKVYCGHDMAWVAPSDAVVVLLTAQIHEALVHAPRGISCPRKFAVIEASTPQVSSRTTDSIPRGIAVHQRPNKDMQPNDPTASMRNNAIVAWQELTRTPRMKCHGVRTDDETPSSSESTDAPLRIPSGDDGESSGDNSTDNCKRPSSHSSIPSLNMRHYLLTRCKGSPALQMLVERNDLSSSRCSDCGVATSVLSTDSPTSCAACGVVILPHAYHAGCPVGHTAYCVGCS